MLKLKRDERGAAVVFMVFLLPIIIVLVLFLVDLIVLIDARMRLVSSLDRAMYAGASSLSYSMNQISHLNWLFEKTYLEKRRDLDRASNEGIGWIERQIGDLKRRQSLLEDEMRNVAHMGYPLAHSVARRVVEKNLRGMGGLISLKYTPLYGIEDAPLFDMVDDVGLDGRYKNIDVVEAAEISGAVYDPSDYKVHRYELKKYLKKDPSYVAMVAALEAKILPPFLPRFFASAPLRITATSASQPFGGSIKDFANTPAENLDEAIRRGRDFLYHPALVPLSAVVEGRYEGR